MQTPNTPPVTIRAAVAADVPAIGVLGAILVQIHHDFDQTRFIAPTPQTAKSYGSFVGSQFKEPNVVVLVAEREGRLLGYAWGSVEGYDYMTLRGPAGLINDIVVEPASRGQGVGHLLLDQMLDALKKRGAPRVVLSTAAKNESAQRLFARAGFRQTMIEMTRESDSNTD